MNLRPLALTDIQLEIVQRAARSLPVEQRDRFLEQIASQLRDQPGTAAVEVAVNRALVALQPVFFCDSASRK